ncbi:hypothetical protein [Pseudovibrio sp. Tun.PSC04-5.I4]|uniref:hypothetical protein n=1 Tax=Pseudovibrio sp. Tun.PSC04-5.I4 TaxID=1798213 RepID=UPI00088E67A9|nr:hypothetical protein [Pseudovibrio sp. Tun.PSC04-5.I4]SDQ75447.1 hypothetical protein SAMN04515695_1271 [Pseudovibrio sp. Tun.PSC04-5.I4]
MTYTCSFRIDVLRIREKANLSIAQVAGCSCERVVRVRRQLKSLGLGLSLGKVMLHRGRNDLDTIFKVGNWAAHTQQFADLLFEEQQIA